MIAGEGGLARVLDTRKALDLHLHVVEVMDGEFAVGETVRAEVNAAERAATRRNHSATHLLQSALRQVLGEHVKQSGSMVSAERLRFDFSHYAATTHDELRGVEEIVNRAIRDDLPITTTEMDAERALESGATALFGEKYGARVRVVEMADFSRELCGGTHAGRTGEIGVFKIVSETGVAAGTRRIEAITGERAFAHFYELERTLKEIAGLLKCRPEESPDRVRKLADRAKELEKAVQKMKTDAARGGSGGEGPAGTEREIKGVKVWVRNFGDVEPGALRTLVDEMKAKLGSGVAVAASAHGGKAALCVGVTKDLVKRVAAGDVVKLAAAVVGGSGGGRPDMAQAGGPAVDKLDEALDATFGIVERLLG